MATFYSLTDEFLKQLGTYLFPVQTPDKLRVPMSLVCFKLGQLLKPVKDDLMVEVDSKEYWWRLVNDAPDDVLARIVRLRLNFSLDGDDDPSTESEHYWSSFISFLHRLPNLVELYFTATPFCYHPGIAQTFPLSLPDLSGLSRKFVSFANEVRCRCCAEQLTNAFMESGHDIQHLKTASEDSVSREDAIEPWDICMYVQGCETLLIKSFGLDTYSELPLGQIAECCSDLKRLEFSGFDLAGNHGMLPRAQLECTRVANGIWDFFVDGQGIGEDLTTYADGVGQFTNLEIFDPGFVITFPNIIDTLPSLSADLISILNVKFHSNDAGFDPAGPESQQLPPKMVETIDLYKARRIEALVAATRVMKSRVPGLRQMVWWQNAVLDLTATVDQFKGSEAKAEAAGDEAGKIGNAGSSGEGAKPAGRDASSSSSANMTGLLPRRGVFSSYAISRLNASRRGNTRFV
ncbi:hypothetical protein I317_04841 [Kwoniella heveanensis CBS 569]|nr:hypothetical protein I317_04841 [Kwoniella heveanensis CBS 569]